MTIAEAEWAMGQAIDALDKALQSNVVHLDIKPSNFLLDEDGTLLLTDFGLAKTLGQSSEESDKAYGTPAYMSPEQIKRASADQRSDIYGLGASIYHLITGELLYDAETITGIVKGHVYRPFPIERAEASGLPSGWIHVLEKMTRKEPDDRFQNYAELREAFLNINYLPAPDFERDATQEVSPYTMVARHTGNSEENLFGILSDRYLSWATAGADLGIKQTKQQILDAVEGTGVRELRIDALISPLKDLMSASEASLSELAEALAEIPEADAYVLQLANSPLFYQGDELVDKRKKAIKLVGKELVQGIIFAILMIKEHKNTQAEFNWKSYWVYALSTAVIAKHLIDLVEGNYVLGVGPADEKAKRGFGTNLMRRPLVKASDYTFIASLLHGIGKQVLSEASPYPYFGAIQKSIVEKKMLADAEEDILMINHHEAGEIWVQKRLSDANLKGICLYYNDYSTSYGLLSSIIAVSSYIARYCGLGYSGDPYIENIMLWDTPCWDAVKRYSKSDDLTPDRLEAEYLPYLAQLPLVEL